MNRHSSIVISLGLNLALTAVVISLLLSRHGTELPRSTTAQSNSETQVVPPRNAPGSAVETLIEVNAPFSWNEVASADLRVYAANLRAVGCPERTVRDIIVSEVNELFKGRVRALVEPEQNRFWELVVDEEALERTVNEKYEALQALSEERDALLQSALGDLAGSERSEDNRTQLELRRKEFLDFLSPPRLQQALALEVKYEELGLNLPASLTDQERNEQRKELDAKFMEELAGLLSPEELAEYRLRNSNHAGERFSLLSIEVTESETRELARLQQQFADPKSGKRPQTKEAAAQFDEAARALLGEERFAEYQRAQDNRYPELLQVMERLGLGAHAAADALEIRKAAEDAASLVRSQPLLEPEEKAETLRQIRAETQQAMAKLMGGTNYAIYRKKLGGWMRNLGNL